MYTKVAIVAALLAAVEARFGQEGLIQGKISALGNFGQPGQAATLGGATPGVLLAATNACDKLQLADKIVATLGKDPQVIAAAAQLVAAEKNFNPFAVSIPSLCSDVNLPATPELRGIVPLVDPAVVGSNVENAKSAASLKTPFDATGKSVADVAKANGFSNFTTQAANGATGNAGNANAGKGNAGNANAGNANAGKGNAGNANAGKGNAGNAGNANAGKGNAGNAAAGNCGGVQTGTTTGAATNPAGNGNAGGEGKQKKGKGKGNKNNDNGNAVNPNTNTAAAGSGSGSNNNGGGGAAAAANTSQKSSIAGLDFGVCVPTMKFVAGLGGRPATEFTFQAIEPKIAARQQEALNPNIITNRVCDDLTNICSANQAAKNACQQAKAQISALGTRNKATAEKWNELLGFAGVNVSQ